MTVSFRIPGATGLEILRRAVADGQVICLASSEQSAAGRLNGSGYLSRAPERRKPEDGALWHPTERAHALLAHLAAARGEPQTPAAPPAPMPAPVASKVDMPAMQAKADAARHLLRDGDVMAARMLASGLYDEAQAGGRFANRFNARDSLDACRRIQGDALMIESKAKIRIAEEWDAAQRDGRALKGRPKSISDENTFRQEEVGLSAQEVHEARKLAKAEAKQPGIVERAIQARLQAGLEPTRANLRAAVGTATATKDARKNNLYETPPEAMFTLLALEAFSPLVVEPSCGRGAISRMLEAAGHDVILADLVDYETADRHGEMQRLGDFRESARYAEDDYDIVTNPPYGDVLNAFVAHALRVHRPRKMALLLNLNFLCGFADGDRNFVMDENPPARVHVFKRRLPMMHRDGWDGPEASSRMNTAWFVWERQPDGTYGDSTAMRRVDWADYMPKPAEGEGQ